MNRIKDDEIPNVSGNDGDALDANAAIHLEGTGFPWQKDANVYIAGHRLGYPNTGSFLSFFDLNKLQDGDEVFVTDANGTKYTYKVFREFAVSPEQPLRHQARRGKERNNSPDLHSAGLLRAPDRSGRADRQDRGKPPSSAFYTRFF